jgi:hypothetical protein
VLAEIGQSEGEKNLSPYMNGQDADRHFKGADRYPDTPLSYLEPAMGFEPGVAGRESDE